MKESADLLTVEYRPNFATLWPCFVFPMIGLAMFSVRSPAYILFSRPRDAGDIVLWIAVAFFLFIAIIFSPAFGIYVALFYRLRLEPEGIVQQSGRSETRIPWDRVVGAHACYRPVRHGSEQYVMVEIRDFDEYLRHLPAAAKRSIERKRHWRGNGVPLESMFIPVKAQKLVKEIRRRATFARDMRDLDSSTY